MLILRANLLLCFVALFVAQGCTYTTHVTPTYESTGVKLLRTLPESGNYENFGLRAWGFYRPGFAEPSLADVWEALSAKVKELGGNACVIRYEKVGGFTARTLEVTCEVLRVK